MALLAENGPCWANEYGNGTIPNEFSWTNKANVIWVSLLNLKFCVFNNYLKVDQPAGAGFSSGVWDYNENGVAEDFYDFLQEFYVQLPQYKNNSLYITGDKVDILKWSITI